MSTSSLKRRLREAKKIWQQELQNSDLQGQGGYMPGILKGLEEALKIVEELHRQKILKICETRRPLTRWSAVDLYHACEHAYGRLLYSDRSGAMRALKRALDKNKSCEQRYG